MNIFSLYRSLEDGFMKQKFGALVGGALWQGEPPT